MDCNLPFAVGSIFATFFSVGGDLLTVMVVTRYFIFAAFPILLAYRLVMNTYLRASREIQRLQSTSQSPVLTFMSELTHGVQIIRAFGKDTIARVIIRNEALLDLNSVQQFMGSATSAWFVLRIQIVGALILLCISFLAFASHLPPGLIGLSISYGINVSNGLEGAVMILSWFENSMVCPERIQQYCDVESEGTANQKKIYRRNSLEEEGEEEDNDDNDGSNVGSQLEISTNVGLMRALALGQQPESEVSDVERGLNTTNSSNETNSSSISQENTTICSAELDLSTWPKYGSIEFRCVSFRYQPLGELVLKKISFTIHGGQKIGLVGRTGSGKSSLSLCLFRIAELAAGEVFIDGVDIANLELHQLRSAIEIVPQNPVLFKGPLRSYMDPFDEYSDTEIYVALEKCYLIETVQRCSESSTVETNDFVASESGSNSTYNALHSSSSKPNNSNRKNKKGAVVTNQSKRKPLGQMACLYAELSENGDNLSVGERQMLVLARALLRGGCSWML